MPQLQETTLAASWGNGASDSDSEASEFGVTTVPANTNQQLSYAS